MGEKLFIGIGVENAKGLPTLPGVLNSIAWIADWADSQGYDVVKISDENGAKVDVARIAAELGKLLKPGHKRILVYFAGHGFSVPPDQYLILSAGPDVPRERITRNGFRDILATYAPDQISVITDACRVMKPFRGLADSVIEPLQGELSSLQTFDGFYAAQDGAQAFAFQADANDPALCVFTWVLHRGLTFKTLEACDDTLSSDEQDVITSGSLAKYLFRAVPIEAAARKVWQKPDVFPGFIRPDDIYSQRERQKTFVTTESADGGGRDFGAPKTSGGGAWGAIEDDDRARGVEEEPQDSLEKRISSEWRKPFMEWAFAQTEARELGAGLVLNGSDRRISIANASAQDLSFVALDNFDGAQPPKSRAAFGAAQTVLWPASARGRSQTLLVSSGEASALIPMHAELWTAAQLDGAPGGAGLEIVGWGSPYYPPAESDAGALSPQEILKGLLRGTINAGDAARIATSIRALKHQDPLLGIVAAYLYDMVGDIDNNRRMCAFYQDHNQDVPFDIALLARAPFIVKDGLLAIDVPETKSIEAPGPDFVKQATRPCVVYIAGVAPLLRAGWAQLNRTGLDWHKKLLGYAKYLTESPLATFEGEDARHGIASLLQQPF